MANNLRLKESSNSEKIKFPVKFPVTREFDTSTIPNHNRIVSGANSPSAPRVLRVKSSSELEGIENGNIQIGDVGGVPCHQCHAMDFGGCRQKAVDNRQRAAGVEPAPFIATA